MRKDFFSLVLLLLLASTGVQGIDYDDQEQEIDTAFLTGFKSMSGKCEECSLIENPGCSGGAGEGRQHLTPNGDIPNRPEVKTDEELPAFCHPPNPCPLGVEGTEKKDSS